MGEFEASSVETRRTGLRREPQVRMAIRVCGNHGALYEVLLVAWGSEMMGEAGCYAKLKVTANRQASG